MMGDLKIFANVLANKPQILTALQRHIFNTSHINPLSRDDLARSSTCIGLDALCINSSWDDRPHQALNAVDFDVQSPKCMYL